MQRLSVGQAGLVPSPGDKVTTAEHGQRVSVDVAGQAVQARADGDDCRRLRGVQPAARPRERRDQVHDAIVAPAGDQLEAGDVISSGVPRQRALDHGRRVRLHIKGGTARQGKVVPRTGRAACHRRPVCTPECRPWRPS